jgi:riboflavin biosynthesis pyrimidine reductase
VRSLLPPGDGAVDLDAVYAPPRRRWVRASFIASADGAVSVDGVSRGLQVPADPQVLAALRGHADVVLVGGRTARVEGYGPARVSHERRQRRVRAGQPAVPPIAVASRAGDPGLPAAFYAGEAAPIILTTEEAAAPLPGAIVLGCGRGDVDLAAALDALAERGLTQVLCEGGPRLFASLVATGRLDELCLTVAPQLVGPGPSRLVEGPGWRAPAGLRLTGVLESDGALFLRYLSGPDSSPARS